MMREVGGLATESSTPPTHLLNGSGNSVPAYSSRNMAEADDGDGQKPQNVLVLLDKFVKNALKSRSRDNDGEHYDRLCRSVKEASEEQLRTLLDCLKKSVTLFDEACHSELISTILGLDLWSVSTDTLKSFFAFLIKLVSAEGGCLYSCVGCLIRNLVPGFLWSARPEDSLDESNISSKLINKESMFLHICTTLHQLFDIAPHGLQHFTSLVEERFPHIRRPKACLLLFIEGLFSLLQHGHAKMFREKVLTLIVSSIVQMDSEIRIEDICPDEDDVFTFEVELDEKSRAQATNKAQQREMADKLDCIMEMVFAHISQRFQAGDGFEIYCTLLHCFEGSIMHAYMSKFSQFLIFYICSLDSSRFALKFMGRLIHLVTTPEQDRLTRRVAASYLASYMARAKFLPSSALIDGIEQICHFCVDYVSQREAPACLARLTEQVITLANKSASEDILGDQRLSWLKYRQSQEEVQRAVDQHIVFYSTCQAILYILCFRIDEVIDEAASQEKNSNLGKQVNRLKALPLQLLIQSSFSPLLVCSTTVANEFIRIAEDHGLCEVAEMKNVVEKIQYCVEPQMLSAAREPCPGEREDEREHGGDSRHDNNRGALSSSQLRLDMFYPFDPYVLPKSGHYIKGNFLIWKGTQNKYEDEDEHDDDDDSNSSDDDEDLSDKNMSLSLGSSMRSIREGTISGTISPLSKPSVDSSSYSFDDPMTFSPI